MTLNGLRILLAEDNPTNQMVATQMLESLGAVVSVAGDGKEALEFLHQEDFDAALIDIEMPRISGVDLIRMLRAEQDRFATLPLIALTAYVMREHRAAIDEAGADGIIAKPILSIEDFGNELRQILDGARDTRGSRASRERPAADGEPATIDETTFRELCAAFDETRQKELIGKISRDIETACDQVATARASMDFETIRAATHVLISVSGTIGASRLMSLTKCLNSAGHDSDSRKIEKLVPELISEAGRVLGYIDRA